MNDLRGEYGNSVYVPPANGNDAYGLQNTWGSSISSYVSMAANLTSNVLLAYYQSMDQKEEANSYKNAAIALGAVAILIHWVDGHFKNTNLDREKEVYDRAIETLYDEQVTSSNVSVIHYR